jgi:hypothetical protein
VNARYRREGCRNCHTHGFPRLEIVLGDETVEVCQACAPKEASVPHVIQHVMAGTKIVLYTQESVLRIPVPWYTPPTSPPVVYVPWIDVWVERFHGFVRWFKAKLSLQ